MDMIGRYAIVDCLYSSSSTSLYRARKPDSEETVILKVFDRDHISPQGLKLARQEFELLHKLQCPGVIEAFSLEEHGALLVLVLSDFHGEALSLALKRKRFSISEFLTIALNIANALGTLHTKHIIHRDINPSNILIDGNLNAQIIDFGISARIPRDIYFLDHPSHLEGTIIYISPEQTGRMNRTIDHRTDLYSLGISLYEMLVGSPPFQSDDVVELIFCHISKKPTAPSRIDPQIPKALSDIVMKLLAKNAEERYKSAFGLYNDLLECKRLLESTGEITPFTLAQKDRFDRFQIPQKLYGRETELAALEQAFARVSAGSPELMLVSGVSGAGKSSIIRELFRCLAAHPGFFFAGKYDRLRRDVPYSAILHALGELVEYLLAEPAAQLAKWQKSILKAVGSSGQVLIEVLPQLELIIGKQPPVPELPPTGARNRFQYVFTNFVKVFTKPGRPFVLFLDDLQWADSASIDLLVAMLSDPDMRALLLIGAFREEEVKQGDALFQAKQNIVDAGCRVSSISINSLTLESIHALVSDCLQRSLADTSDLARLVWQRTLGNALFAGQFMLSLYKSHLIEFNADLLRWEWDLSRIAAAPGLDTVGDILASRTLMLDLQTAEILRAAACIGNAFDSQTLAQLLGQPVDAIEWALISAIEENLVVHLGQEYRFLHDRIQHTIYNYLSPEQRAKRHYQLGKLLLANHPTGKGDDQIFSITNHLNFASILIDSRAERIELAQLNLMSGERARSAAAFGTAQSFFSAGIDILPADCWSDQHDLAFNMYLGAAATAFLAGQLDDAERIFEKLTQVARSALERARLLELRLNVLTHRGQLQEALDVLLPLLELLGVKLSSRPSMAHVLMELGRAKLAMLHRSYAELTRMPEQRNPHSVSAIRIMCSAMPAALQANPNLLAVMLMRMTAMSAQEGPTSLSAISYVNYAAVVGSSFGSFEVRQAIGKLALELTERFPDKRAEGAVKTVYGFQIHPFRASLREAFEYIEVGHRLYLETGEYTWASYGVLFASLVQRMLGAELGQLAIDDGRRLAFVKKAKNAEAILIMQLLAHTSRSLSGSQEKDISGLSSDFDEQQHASLLEHSESLPAKHLCWAIQMQTLYLHGQIDAALQICRQLQRNVDMAIGIFSYIVEVYYYTALVYAASYDRAGQLERAWLLVQLRLVVRKLKKWADNAPMNFSHKYALAAAELARLTKNGQSAMQLYEEAIQGARGNGFHHDKAIALELAGRFYQSNGSMLGLQYLQLALQEYTRWGANAKVSLLTSEFRDLGRRAESEEHPTLVSTAKSTSRTTAMAALDLPMMISATQALSSEINLHRLLEQMMKIVIQMAGAEQGALLLTRGDRLELAAVVSAQQQISVTSEAWTPEGHFDVSAAVLHFVLRTQKTIVLADAARDGAFTKDPYIARKQAKSVLCMPLLQHGEVRGALYLENNLSVGAFSPERVQLLNVLCAQMAISSENAYMYQNMEALVADRTKQLEAAQQQIVKLEKESLEKQMAGGFAHEMRNALSGAMLLISTGFVQPDLPVDGTEGHSITLCSVNSDLLMRMYKAIHEVLPPDMHQELIDAMSAVNDNEGKLDHILIQVRGCITRALSVTQMILDYSKLGHELRGNEKVLLIPLIQSILAESASDFHEHNIQTNFEYNEALALRGQSTHFYSIFKNIITNARDALTEVRGERVRSIFIKVQRHGQRACISVQDTGIGIAKEHYHRLGEPFFSTKPATGTGLGLAVVKKLIDLYGAELKIESTYGEGTTFFLTFPCDDEE